MLRRLTIVNFQSIRQAALDFGPVTVLVGESDAGKSAVLRAIRAVVTSPVGSDFRTQGTGETMVSLELDDAAVTWTKADSPAYRVDRSGGSAPALYSGFGRTVPAPVVDLLRLGPLAVGDEVVWPSVHQQFDLPFLVGETAAVRARVLGELSGVSRLYLATREARRLEAGAKRLRSVRWADGEALDQQIERYAGLDEQVGAVVSLRGLLDQYVQSAQDASERRLAAGRLRELRQAMAPGHTGALEALVADLERSVRSAQGALARREALRVVEASLRSLRLTERAVGMAEQQRAAYGSRLAAVRTCPLCRQPVGAGHWDRVMVGPVGAVGAPADRGSLCDLS